MASLCFSSFKCKGSDRNASIDLNTISGKILFRDPLIEGNVNLDKGLVLLDPLTTEITPIGIFGGNARFTSLATKILVGVANTVELFDVETKEKVLVYQSKNLAQAGGDIAYVDETHFSIAESNKIILVDLQNGSETEVVEATGIRTHSWSKDGETVYYSTYTTEDSNKVSNHIFKLNIKTGQKEYLFDGICPKVSQDGDLIAYFPDRNRTKLIVRELDGENLWEYTAPMVDFCFSPGGEYIASVEWWRGPWYYDGYTVKILDYKIGKAQTIVPKYANGQCFDIDWAE